MGREVRPAGRPRAGAATSRDAMSTRREAIRLLRARDRLGNKLRHAEGMIEREEKRIAALAVELAKIDQELRELDAGAGR